MDFREGQKVKSGFIEDMIILCVGEKKVFCRLKSGEELSFLKEEVKPQEKKKCRKLFYFYSFLDEFNRIRFTNPFLNKQAAILDLDEWKNACEFDSIEDMNANELKIELEVEE